MVALAAVAGCGSDANGGGGGGPGGGAGSDATVDATVPEGGGASSHDASSVDDADATLGRDAADASDGGDGGQPGVTPPWKWGPVQKDQCTGEGLRQVSAPLRNVPSVADAGADSGVDAGVDLRTACESVPRNVMGVPFARPDRCVITGSDCRGQWDVPDTSCLSLPPAAPVRGGDGTLSSSAPLEGYADLHLHQMAHLGFGGTIVWGGAYGAPDQVLTPIPSDMKKGHDQSEALFDGDILGGIAGTTTHGENGYPDFMSWPSRDLATHQQAYEDWLFRAYQGGLRLMVMLAVNSEDMFGRGENDITVLGTIAIQSARLPGRTTNDMETLEWQIREAYRMQDYIDARFGGPGQGWYRIVRDPDEASAAVAGGKLAVILGTELQHLFNCDSDRPDCTSDTVVEGLNRLEAMGVNYVFPIHHKVTQYGGPSQFNPLTNGPTEDCFETVEACSSVGLSDLGRTLIEEMTTRGMLIDTEHMSWKTFDDAMHVVEDRAYPVFASHIAPFDLNAEKHQTEQLRKTDQFRRILGVGGMLGLISGAVVEEYSPTKTTPVRLPISCGGADQWANAYLYARDLSSGGLQGASGRITYGSDWNGFSSWPAPRFGATPCTSRTATNGQPIPKPAPVTYPIALPAALVPAANGAVSSLPRFEQFRVWDYNELGLTHAGLVPDFIEDLRLTGLTVADLEPIYRSARGVVELWRTARDKQVPGDKHRVRWVPRSPFDLLPFDYADTTRNVEASPGFALCRSRREHKLGFDQNHVCQLVEATTAPPSPGTLLPAVMIPAYHAGRCLQVSPLLATLDGAPVQQGTCNSATYQKWQVRSSDGQLWEVVNVASGKCLDLASTGSGAVQQACSGGAGQKWNLARTGNTFSIRDSQNGQCLEVPDQSRADGVALARAACSGAANQQWDIDSMRASDDELLYQADKNRIAWLAAADSAHPFAVTVDGTRAVCRSADAERWVGVVSGAQCVGRTYAGAAATTATFEELFQTP